MLKITSILLLLFVSDFTSNANDASITTTTEVIPNNANNSVITEHLAHVTTIADSHVTTVATHKHDEGSVDARRAGSWIMPNPLITGCGNEFSCVRYYTFKTDRCTGMGCEYMLAYKPPTEGSVEFFLAARKADFVAVGFTEDSSRVPTELLTCSAIMNSVKLNTYVWDGKQLQELSTPNNNHLQLLNDGTGEHGLWCLVKRSLEPWNKLQMRNLEDNYYQVYLWGNLDESGKPNIVDNETYPTDWFGKSFKTSLTSKITESVIVSKPDITPEEIDCSALSCVRIFIYSSLKDQNNDCNYNDCSYLLAFQGNLMASRKWSVVLSAANAQFVAVGLTSDPETKARTEVIGCKKTKSGTVEMFHSWFTNPSQSYPQHQHSGLKFINGAATKNGLWCNIVRPLQPLGTYWNLSHPSYQLYLWGSLDESGEPAIWKSNVYPSDDKIDLIKTTKMNDYKQEYKSGGTAPSIYSFTLVVQVILISLYLS